MLVHLFVSAACILSLGLAALRFLEKSQAVGFLTGALTLGGGIIICALFSLQSRWHGIIGAGIVALLGAARGLANLADLPAYFSGESPRGHAPLLEAGITFICISLLIRVLRCLHAEKIRRMLAEDSQREG